MNQKKYLIFISFICVFALGFSLSGCGGSGGSADGKAKITVAFWGSPEEKEIILDSVKEWQANNPHIELRMEHTPAGGYVQKMLTRLAGGTPPDIFAIRVDHFITFASKNVLLDLTSYIAEDPEFRIDDYFPAVVDNFIYNDSIFAIPRDTAPYACVYYNKEAFDKRGVSYPTDDWNWNDMLQKAKALSYVDERGRKRYGYYGWSWENFVYSNGGSLVDDVKHPTKTLLDEPPAIEALQFYADLINTYEVMPTPIALQNLGMGIDMMFADGYVAMFQSGIWETPALRTYSDLSWDVAMFPKGPNGIRRFGTGGSAYGIISKTKHPKEAWEVLKILSGPIGQTQLASRGLAQPAIESISRGEHWAGSDLQPSNKTMLNEAVSHVVYDPFHEDWNEAKSKYVIPQLELLFNGKQDAKTAVHKFVEPVNMMLQE